MSYEVNENGYMLNHEEWNEDIAREIAAKEGIELTDKHWDLVNYLRDEYVNNVIPPFLVALKSRGFSLFLL